jgi:hypothetical protein
MTVTGKIRSSRCAGRVGELDLEAAAAIQTA